MTRSTSIASLTDASWSNTQMMQNQVEQTDAKILARIKKEFSITAKTVTQPIDTGIYNTKLGQSFFKNTDNMVLELSHLAFTPYNEMNKEGQFVRFHEASFAHCATLYDLTENRRLDFVTLTDKRQKQRTIMTAGLMSPDDHANLTALQFADSAHLGMRRKKIVQARIPDLQDDFIIT